MSHVAQWLDLKRNEKKLAPRTVNRPLFMMALYEYFHFHLSDNIIIFIMYNLFNYKVSFMFEEASWPCHHNN